MRKVLALVLFLTVVPTTAAAAEEMDDLLGRSQEASYSAEQVISCATPDGSRNALVHIEQTGGEMRVASSVGSDVEVTVGAGGWSLTRSGGLVAEANVGGGREKLGALYTVEDSGEVEYLGRDAAAYVLIRDGEPRARLVIDSGTGVVVEALTFTLDGTVYCERRFISLDPSEPESGVRPVSATEPTSPLETNDLPDEVLGFDLLDEYLDDDEVRFAYYSDGFFSFALFEVPAMVALPNATIADFESGSYLRSFTAGQVSYAWETKDGAMALVGDLPPDMHEEVLAEMPHPEDPGLLRRWWRALFG